MSAILKVGERKDRRRGRGEVGQHSYERTWFVETDGPMGMKAISAAFGVPQPYTVYATSTETDLTARVTSHAPRQLRNTDKAYEVVVRYESVSGPGGPLGVDEKWQANPLMRPPRMSMHFEEAMVPVIGTLKDIWITPDSTDIYEDPVLNAAGQAYVPQPEVEDGTPIIVIQRNEPAFYPAFAIEYNNSVNSDQCLGALPRQLKVRITCPGGETVVVGSEEVRYYPVTYTMKGKREGWDLRQANRGTYYVTTGAVFKDFKDEGLGDENWLKANGDKNPGVPNYIKHRHYREKPFANFNLPNQFI